MIVTSAANSHQNSRSNQPRLDAIDDDHATVMAMAISSIIPGARSRTSDTAPFKNGQPPQTNTNVPSTGPTHATPLGGTRTNP